MQTAALEKSELHKSHFGNVRVTQQSEKRKLRTCSLTQHSPNLLFNCFHAWSVWRNSLVKIASLSLTAKLKRMEETQFEILSFHFLFTDHHIRDWCTKEMQCVKSLELYPPVYFGITGHLFTSQSKMGEGGKKMSDCSSEIRGRRLPTLLHSKETIWKVGIVETEF